MFDIGFWELMLIGIVALLVIGPERLPKLARTAGYWMGRGQRFISTVKEDIDREMRADELKKILNEQSKVTEFEEVIEETSSAFRAAKDSGKLNNPGNPDPTIAPTTSDQPTTTEDDRKG